uniref:RING-type E3 ubiquitin transferase n=1 Tax=Latimeria chalumnae TaxID=7897 RepID=H3B6W4_LATCH
AKNLFKQIVDQYSEEHFQCFGFYGSGRVYHRQNRFSDAFKEFAKSLKMVNLKIVPGILTWPTSTVVIEESRTEKLKGILEAYIEECKFPPEPDAVCRYQQCQSSSKIQIYFTDPDFKGFIRLMCCQFCRVEFHINCWKKLKTISFSDKNDKDFLEDQCFTPDCGGSISKIVIIGSTGLVKCEFESKMIKRREPPKPVVKQKCSSIRKLKSKEDCKLRRKQLRKEAMKAERERQEESNQKSSGFKNNIDSGTLSKCHFSDRVLQQIIENRDLIQSGVVDTSQLLADLMSWRVINQEQRELFEKKTAQSEVIEELINILTQKNNHVMTRVFLHFLNLCQETEPKLHDWTQRLNNIDLFCTPAFINLKQNLMRLEQHIAFPACVQVLVISFLKGQQILDFNSLCVCIFCVSKCRKFSALFFTLQKMQYSFVFCLNIHDKYEPTDGPCIVLKKQENEDISNIGVKFKGKSRKKKQKEVKPILVISGTIGGGTQDEDGMFTDEDSLDRMFLSSHDPFTVPEYLQDQLEAFENLYDDNSSSSRYQRFLDNDPDPSRESLYDYFAQILKEHGPMEIDNELLTSQFKIFPSEAQELVQNSGGLKPFLLESLRFVMMDNLIGLMKHAVLLKENSAASGIHLDPAAKEFQPNRNLLDLTNGTLSFIESPRYNDDRYLAQNYYSAETTLELEALVGGQVYKESTVHTEVNTDPYYPIETQQGDILRMEKEHKVLKDQLKETKEKYEQLQERSQEEISDLEGKLNQEIENCKVSKTEVEWLRQSLETEIKKGQQEKREKQELFKVLKNKIKSLNELIEKSSRNIEDKEQEYKKYLKEFLEVSNKSAAEKVKLEELIKKNEDSCQESGKRAVTAEVSVLESGRDIELYKLNKAIADAEMNLNFLRTAASWKLTSSIPPLQSMKSDWESYLLNVKSETHKVESQFQERISMVTNGGKLGDLTPVQVATFIPPIPLLPALDPLDSKQPAQSKPAGSGPLQHSKNSFEKIIDRLLVMFPHYNSQILTYFIKEVRTSNGGTLSGLAYDEIITRVADLILAHQDITRFACSSGDAVLSEVKSNSNTRSSITSSLSHHAIIYKNTHNTMKPFSLIFPPFEEDPCIICHDDLSQETLCVLECGHRFHKECIKEWLKKQSTCPTCRVHALLPEDFPALAGRIKLPHVSIS